MTTLLLCALGLAEAHVPHSVASAMAVPRHDPDVPWYLIVVNEVPTTLYRSDDRGVTWAAQSGAVMQDDIYDGAYTDAGFAAFLALGRLWWTADGATWTADALPSGATELWSPLAGGEYVFLASPDGVYAVEPGVGATLELPLPGVFSVHEGEDGPVAVSDDAHVWWRGADGTWADLGAPAAEDVYSGTSSDGVVWAGSVSGRVYVWADGTWRECAEPPLGKLGVPHAMIEHLDARAGRLFALRPDGGPARSLDGCASWEATVSPNQNDFREDGLASWTDDDRAFVTLATVADSVVVAGFDGVSTSQDVGDTWHAAPVVGADFNQAVVLSNTFAEDGRMLLATYGSGVTRVSGFGAEVAGDNYGTHVVNVQDLWIPESAAADEVVWGIYNMDLFRSEDSGVTWASFEDQMLVVRGVTGGPGSRVYALGVEGGPEEAPGHVFRSEDGATWTTLAALPTPMVGEFVANIVDRPGWLCAQSTTRVACSADDGETWSEVHAAVSNASRITNVALWPAAAPSALLITDRDGLWRWDGATRTQVRTSDHAQMMYFAVTDDDRIYAVDLVGWLWESLDGGITWSDTGGRVPGQTRSMAARPDFAHHPDVFIAGVDGTFVWHDGALSRFAAYQRVDDSSQYLLCTGCTLVTDTTASLETLNVLPAGARFEVNLRGSRLSAIGASTGGAVVRAWVDDEPLGELSIDAGADAARELLVVDGLPDGWHRWELAVDVGELTLDAVESHGEGLVLAGDTPVDTGDTGDTGDSGETGETGDTGGTGETGESAETADSGETDDSPAETGEPKTDEPTGCGCASSIDPRAPWAVVVAGAVLLRRRRG